VPVVDAGALDAATAEQKQATYAALGGREFAAWARELLLREAKGEERMEDRG